MSGDAGATPRVDGRMPDQLRPVKITPDFLAFADASALIEVGDTRVLCAVTIEQSVPRFLKGRGRGWVTAEYAMLPRATPLRTPREAVTGRVGGRTHEIQRLIGRSLRAVVDLAALGERTFLVDCDVLQADGGTRTASITGAYVALALACAKLVAARVLPAMPFHAAVAATSVGIVGGVPLLDLCYEEDSRAAVDFNVVMTSAAEFVEVQGTAEGRPFTRATIDQLLGLAESGIRELLAYQAEAISGAHRAGRQE